MRARTDSNAAQLDAAFLAHGWLVAKLDGVGRGFPDRLVWRADHGLVLVEYKAGRGKLRQSQATFQSAGWPVAVLRTVDDVAAVSRRSRRRRSETL